MVIVKRIDLKDIVRDNVRRARYCIEKETITVVAGILVFVSDETVTW